MGKASRVRRATLAFVTGATLIAVASASAAPYGEEQRAAPAGMLAFTTGIHNRIIEIVRRDGTGRRAVTHHPPPGHTPAWVAGGSRFTFVTHDGELWISRRDGSKPEGRQYWCHLPVRRGLGGSAEWSSPSSISLFGLCSVRWFVAAAGCI
jgi:hypothetical protein